MAARIRLLAAAKNMSATDLRDAIGLKRSAMSNYWTGKRPYPIDAIPRIAAHLSTTVDQIISGDDAANVQDSELDLVRVDEVDLAYGLGGTYADGWIETITHHFPRKWLESITSTPPNLLTIAKGRGDSMMPTLMDGDMVLIDRSQRNVREQDAMWAFTIGDIAMIKRVRVRGEKVLILSDNDRVPTDEAHHEEVRVVGRVIFIGRNV